MRAILRQARISPKKANLVASMVRRLSARDAMKLLQRVPKKGARILYGVIASAVANAAQNDHQTADHLVIRTLIVNKGPAYRRYLPIARGRARPIDKWTSHITVELGVDMGAGEGKDDVRTVKAPKSTSRVPRKKDDSDIVYSENKPVTQDHYKKASDAADGEQDVKESHGHATFQPQRKGSRGS